MSIQDFAAVSSCVEWEGLRSWEMSCAICFMTILTWPYLYAVIMIYPCTSASNLWYLSHPTPAIREETLSACRQARDRGCPIVCLTSGGEISRVAKEYNLPALQMPVGYQPRQTLGFSLINTLSANLANIPG